MPLTHRLLRRLAFLLHRLHCHRHLALRLRVAPNQHSRHRRNHNCDLHQPCHRSVRYLQRRFHHEYMNPIHCHPVHRLLLRQIWNCLRMLQKPNGLPRRRHQIQHSLQGGYFYQNTNLLHHLHQVCHRRTLPEQWGFLHCLTQYMTQCHHHLK